MNDQNALTTPSFYTRYQFWFLLLLALICRNLPLIALPFNWLESYFHEISHGLAAITTGGEILRIQLFLNGAGLCTSQGGVRFITSFMGYTGAALWGALIYRLASFHYKAARIVCGLIILLIAVTCLLWVRDITTLFILTVLVVVFSLKFKLGDNRFFQALLQLVGLTVLLNALMSPFHLIDGRDLGDGATLASLTYIPELVWVCIWVVISGLLLHYLARTKYKNTKST